MDACVVQIFPGRAPPLIFLSPHTNFSQIPSVSHLLHSVFHSSTKVSLSLKPYRGSLGDVGSRAPVPERPVQYKTGWYCWPVMVSLGSSFVICTIHDDHDLCLHVRCRGHLRHHLALAYIVPALCHLVEEAYSWETSATWPFRASRHWELPRHASSQTVVRLLGHL